jgi:hypothetical protein
VLLLRDQLIFRSRYYLILHHLKNLYGRMMFLFHRHSYHFVEINSKFEQKSFMEDISDNNKRFPLIGLDNVDDEGFMSIYFSIRVHNSSCISANDDFASATVVDPSCNNDAVS